MFSFNTASGKTMKHYSAWDRDNYDNFCILIFYLENKKICYSAKKFSWSLICLSINTKHIRCEIISKIVQIEPLAGAGTQ